MSSTVFRGSCAIYWFTWIISLAYVIGISIYESKYIAMSEEYSSSVIYVKASCYLNLSFAIVGCIFVKCDVSHIVCFLLYTLPVFVIIPAMCVVSIVEVKAVQDSYKIVGNGSKLSRLVRKANVFHNKSGNRFPHWLQRNEIDHKCCGINNWTDYVTVFAEGKEFAETSKAADANNDFPVPKSCCCRSKNRSDYDALVFNKLPTPSMTPMNILHQKGCGETIIDQFEDLGSSHVIFMIILLCCSMCMVVVYVKSWCSSRTWNGGRSDHSLDIERVSLIDLVQTVDRIDSIHSAGVERIERERPSILMRAAPSMSVSYPKPNKPPPPPSPGGRVAGSIPSAAKYKFSISK